MVFGDQLLLSVLFQGYHSPLLLGPILTHQQKIMIQSQELRWPKASMNIEEVDVHKNEHHGGSNCSDHDNFRHELVIPLDLSQENRN